MTDNGRDGVLGVHAVLLVGEEHGCQHDAAQIPHRGEVGRNARGKVSRERAVKVLTVEPAGQLGQNGANAAKHAHLEMNSGQDLANTLSLGRVVTVVGGRRRRHVYAPESHAVLMVYGDPGPDGHHAV